MSEKEQFINMVENMIEQQELLDPKGPIVKITEEALEYFELIKRQEIKIGSTEMTDNGKEIIESMQKFLEERDNKFLSREIAEDLFTSSRSVSGAMRKLYTDGYVDKTDDSPIVYSLTKKGKEYSVESE